MLERGGADGVTGSRMALLDPTERQGNDRERDRLLAELERRDLLLREVHHRVKNTLQVISSLISMQVRSLPGGESRHALEDCRSQVEAIALINEKLDQSPDDAGVPFSDYTRSLAAAIVAATGPDAARVTLAFDLADVALEVDKALPCGLILNELVTNALKHAFPAGRAGTIRVELVPVAGGGLQLVVGDDGVGLPAGLDVRKSPSLGLQLVGMLAHQLGARLAVDAGAGTTIRLTIPGDEE